MIRLWFLAATMGIALGVLITADPLARLVEYQQGE
jgi:hypothetical protein